MTDCRKKTKLSNEFEIIQDDEENTQRDHLLIETEDLCPDEEDTNGRNYVSVSSKNAFEHSKQLLNIAQTTSKSSDRKYTRTQNKFDGIFRESKSKTRTKADNLHHNDVPKGVTQANGLENEIVKLIEARMTMETAHESTNQNVDQNDKKVDIFEIKQFLL